MSAVGNEWMVWRDKEGEGIMGKRECKKYLGRILVSSFL